MRLNRDYAGITARNRWRIIDDCHSHLVKRKDRDENPLAVWDDPRNDFSMTYTVEQDKHLDPDEEQYTVTKSEVRKMENHISIEPMRDRLLIRLLWQTGLRKGEAVGIEIKDHLDMDARTIRIPAANAKTNQSRVVGYQPVWTACSGSGCMTGTVIDTAWPRTVRICS